ncbi:MAG: phosphatase PAP2 family protein [Promethearchaeota archaeon]
MSLISNISHLDIMFSKKIEQNGFFQKNLIIKLFKIITNIGREYIWIILCIIFAFNSYFISVTILNNFWLGAIVALSIKSLINRKRPFVKLKLDPKENLLGAKTRGNSSFPSWHTINTTMMLLSLIIYFPMTWMVVLNFLLIIFVGLSRIILRMHFLLDVLAGFVIGLVLTPISISLTNIFL